MLRVLLKVVLSILLTLELTHEAVAESALHTHTFPVSQVHAQPAEVGFLGKWVVNWEERDRTT